MSGFRVTPGQHVDRGAIVQVSQEKDLCPAEMDVLSRLQPAVFFSAPHPAVNQITGLTARILGPQDRLARFADEGDHLEDFHGFFESNLEIGIWNGGKIPD